MDLSSPLSSSFERLLAYDRWANGKVLDGLESMVAPPDKARYLIAHLLGAQVSWIERLTAGRDPADWERWETMTVAEARAEWRDAIPARWAAFLADRAASARDRTCSYVNFMGASYTVRVEDALLQLMFHGAYHRGQIASLVRAAGGEPAATDFVRGLREGGFV
jgi:uncharacterized damage-inducible protein DinB